MNGQDNQSNIKKVYPKPYKLNPKFRVNPQERKQRFLNNIQKLNNKPKTIQRSNSVDNIKKEEPPVIDIKKLEGNIMSSIDKAVDKALMKYTSKLNNLIEVKSKFYVDQKLSLIESSDYSIRKGIDELTIANDPSNAGNSFQFKYNGEPVARITESGMLYCKNIWLNGVNLLSIINSLIMTDESIVSQYVKHKELKNGRYEMDIKDIVTKTLEATTGTIETLNSTNITNSEKITTDDLEANTGTITTLTTTNITNSEKITTDELEATTGTITTLTSTNITNSEKITTDDLEANTGTITTLTTSGLTVNGDSQFNGNITSTADVSAVNLNASNSVNANVYYGNTANIPTINTTDLDTTNLITYTITAKTPISGQANDYVKLYGNLLMDGIRFKMLHGTLTTGNSMYRVIGKSENNGECAYEQFYDDDNTPSNRYLQLGIQGYNGLKIYNTKLQSSLTHYFDSGIDVSGLVSYLRNQQVYIYGSWLRMFNVGLTAGNDIHFYFGKDNDTDCHSLHMRYHYGNDDLNRYAGIGLNDADGYDFEHIRIYKDSVSIDDLASAYITALMLDVTQDINVTGDGWIGGNLDIDGHCGIDGNCMINGDLTVQGQTIYHDEIEVAGDADVGGDATVVGNVSCGSLTVDGTPIDEDHIAYTNVANTFTEIQTINKNTEFPLVVSHPTLSNNQWFKIKITDNTESAVMGLGKDSTGYYNYIKLNGRSAQIQIYANETKISKPVTISSNLTITGTGTIPTLSSTTGTITTLNSTTGTITTLNSTTGTIGTLHITNALDYFTNGLTTGWMMGLQQDNNKCAVFSFDNQNFTYQQGIYGVAPDIIKYDKDQIWINKPISTGLTITGNTSITGILSLLSNYLSLMKSDLTAGNEVQFALGKGTNTYQCAQLGYHLDSTLANSYSYLTLSGMTGLKVYGDKVESVTPFYCPSIYINGSQLDFSHLAYTNVDNAFSVGQSITGNSSITGDLSISGAFSANSGQINGSNIVTESKIWASGNNWDVIPYTNSTGYTKVGKYLDFFNTDTDTSVAAQLYWNGTYLYATKGVYVYETNSQYPLKGLSNQTTNYFDFGYNGTNRYLRIIVYGHSTASSRYIDIGFQGYAALRLKYNAITMNYATTCSSTLTVSGATTCSSTLAVTGNTTLTGTLTANSTSSMNGVVTINTTNSNTPLVIDGSTSGDARYVYISIGGVANAISIDKYGTGVSLYKQIECVNMGTDWQSYINFKSHINNFLSYLMSNNTITSNQLTFGYEDNEGDCIVLDWTHVGHNDAGNYCSINFWDKLTDYIKLYMDRIELNVDLNAVNGAFSTSLTLNGSPVLTSASLANVAYTNVTNTFTKGQIIDTTDEYMLKVTDSNVTDGSKRYLMIGKDTDYVGNVALITYYYNTDRDISNNYIALGMGYYTEDNSQALRVYYNKIECKQALYGTTIYQNNNQVLDSSRIWSSGNNWDIIPYTDNTGYTQIGKYLNFYNTDADVSASARIYWDGTYLNYNRAIYIYETNTSYVFRGLTNQTSTYIDFGYNASNRYARLYCYGHATLANRYLSLGLQGYTAITMYYNKITLSYATTCSSSLTVSGTTTLNNTLTVNANITHNSNNYFTNKLKVQPTTITQGGLTGDEYAIVGYDSNLKAAYFGLAGLNWGEQPSISINEYTGTQIYGLTVGQLSNQSGYNQTPLTVDGIIEDTQTDPDLAIGPNLQTAIKELVNDTHCHQDTNDTASQFLTDYTKFELIKIGSTLQSGGCAYSPLYNVFVVMGLGTGKLNLSQDGYLWAEKTVTSESYTGVCWGNDCFIAVCYGNRTVYKSNTGNTSWYSVSNCLPSGATKIRSICYGNGYYVAVGESSQYIYYNNGNPTSASDWQSYNIGTSVTLQCVCYGDNGFVAVGNSGYYCYINSTFSSYTLTQIGGNNRDMYAVCYGPNGYIAGCDNYAYIWKSTNGTSWTSHNLGSTVYIRAVAYGNGRYIATSYNSGNVMFWSTNGSNWYSGTVGTSTNHICYGNGVFVATATSSTNNNNPVAVYVSPNAYISPKAMLASIYPIGALYTSSTDISPSLALGFGTWTSIFTGYERQCIGSQVLYSQITGYGTQTKVSLLGAYNYGLIDGVFANVTIPTGYHKEYRLTFQGSTGGSPHVQVFLNNIGTNDIGTWSGDSFRILGGSNYFKESDITLETTMGYSNPGINLKFSNTGNSDYRIYNITIHGFIVSDTQTYKWKRTA